MTDEKPRRKRNSIVTPEIAELQKKLSEARTEARDKAEEKFIVGIKRKINVKFIELNTNKVLTREEKTAQFKEFIKTL